MTFIVRLLLITPENADIKRYRAGQYNNFTQLTMPYLAGFVPPEYRIRLVDEHTELIPRDRYDLVAVTVNTPNAPHAYNMAERFRRAGTWVALGGPHVTLLPGEAALHGDTVFIGEAEDTWPVFLKEFLAGRQKNVYHCERPPDLKNLPLPRRDLISGYRFTSGSVFATRGCPHFCSYCSLKNIYQPDFRTRPVEEVIEEIQTIAAKHFVFWDDNFFAAPGYTKKLLAALAPLKKRWAAQVTAHSCRDDALLSLAGEAGCVYLFLGLESFTDAGLQDAGKTFNPLEQYADIIDRIHRYGISVQAGVVFGFDSDNQGVFDHALRCCANLGLDGVTASILTPFPGTKLYEQFKHEGRLLPVDWSYYDGKTKVSYLPKQMTPAELLAGYHYFRGNFYSWKSIAGRILRSRTHPLYNALLNLGYRKAYRRYTAAGAGLNREGCAAPCQDVVK